MAKKARKKALAMLIALLTIGQSFSLASFADSSTPQDSSAVSIVETQSGEKTQSAVSKQSSYQGTGDPQPVSKDVVNADGVNPAAAELTKGYSINSEKFDLRNVNGKSYTTPVRSQAPFGTCWSFATVAALESSILGSGLKGADGKTADPKTLNLSEKQIAWFSAMPLDDPTSSQNGEGQFIADFMKTPGGLTNFMNRGGTAMISTSALAQGIGPSHESSDKELEYHGRQATVVSKWSDDSVKKYSYSDTDDWSIPERLRFNSDYSIKETHMLPECKEIDKYGYYHYHEEGTKAIKQELLNLRAVETSFCADTSRPGQDSDAQYISKNWAHYTYLPTFSNHAVTIVGWDDNYPKENFIEGSFEMQMKDGKTVTVNKQPPANGAWLVKNSWGSEENEFPDEGSGNWGIEVDGKNTGYFWLSYYDKTIGESLSYVVEEKNPDVNTTDQYDYMPCMTPDACKFDNEIIMANKFYAQKDEILKQVSCFTGLPDLEVKYDIYLLDDYSDKPTDGIKVATKTVKYNYAGFHKEDLSDGFKFLFDVSGDGSNTFRVSQGQGYSIVVTQRDQKGKYIMNFPNANYNENGGLDSFKGIINAQESYVFQDGAWQDYQGMDEFRKEQLKQFLMGDYDIDAVERSYDNFPIKGYTQTLDKGTMFEIAGNSSVYYATKSQGSANLRLIVHSSTADIPDIKASDVTWGLLPTDDSDGQLYFDGKNGSDPLSYIVTAREGEEKHTRAYVTIKGIGTISTRLVVNKVAIQSIIFPVDGRTGLSILNYPYTGKAVTPCTDVATMAKDPLIQGEDYEFVYKNNVKCGVATVTAKALSDRVVHGFEDFSKIGFVIVPQKPVIKSVKADGTKLIAEVEDQSECDPSGYRIQYRVKGETEWQESLSRGTTPIVCAYGVDPEKEYEVQVSGYTEVADGAGEWYGDKINYGEASDIKTVKTAAAEPVLRIFGDNRFATAAEIAKKSYVNADTVILAYGMNYADALAGVSLAAAMKAPILLTNTDSLPRQTTNAIEKLGAKNVIILGGTGAISEAVEKTLKQQKLRTERIAGSTRFETAAKIAEKLQSIKGEEPEDIFFVYANNFADALSVSSVAAAKGAPVIYLKTAGELDEATAEYLESVNGCVKNAYVIGGSGVISDEMMKTAGDALGIEATRISGKNRYETCIAVNETFKDVLTGNCICVATGADFPDALAGGVYAALYKAPMVLAAGSLSKQQTEYLKNKNAQQIVVFGGTGAVPDELVDKIAKA